MWNKQKHGIMPTTKRDALLLPHAMRAAAARPQANIAYHEEIEKETAMKQHSKFWKLSVILLIGLTVLFSIFFVYMGLFENVSVYAVDTCNKYDTVENYTVEQMTDPTAPCQIRTVYRWRIDENTTSGSCLCFYVVHQYAHVYYDDELVYSLEASAGNRIGDSTSSNWVTLPIHPQDLGKTVTVVLTPLFDSVVHFQPTFLSGSHFAIFSDRLFKDIFQLFLSMLCIVLGIFIIGVQIYFIFFANIKTWDMFLLGGLAIALGGWRITDTCSSPILFSANPMVLGYITIGALLMCTVGMVHFMSTFFSGKKKEILLALSCVGSLIVLVVLLLQVLGVADFKEMLPVCHIMLVVLTAVVLGMLLFGKRDRDAHQDGNPKNFFIILATGIMLDLIAFYVSKSSSYVLYTILAFIVYLVLVFINNVMSTTRKAYTDIRTGLANKTRWNELMNDNLPVAEDTVIIMLDLNGLKQVNDKYGHEAGDRMILHFSNILRNTFPSSSTICRWGGDEFSILASSMERERLEYYIRLLNVAVEKHNETSTDPALYFAVGYALSREYPGLNHRELLAVADSQMYLDKQKWYGQKDEATAD